MQIGAEVDLNGLDRKFMLAAKQSDFALADAINETLKHAQRKQQGYMNRVYTIRSKSLLKASVRMFRFAKASSLYGEMGINRNLMHIWRWHETGGLERPGRSKYIAVPQGVNRTKTGRISKANRPQHIKRGFLVRKGTERYIFKRVGRGRNSKLQFMYSLERQIRIRPTLNFVDNVTHTINKRYALFAEKAVAKELKRAGVKLERF